MRFALWDFNCSRILHLIEEGEAPGPAIHDGTDKGTTMVQPPIHVSFTGKLELRSVLAKAFPTLSTGIPPRRSRAMCASSI